jgi:hypothetical protein
MPRDIFNDLKKVWVCGQQLKIVRLPNEIKNRKQKSRRSRLQNRNNTKGRGKEVVRSKKSGKKKARKNKPGK